jgi:WD40 repeat protein
MLELHLRRRFSQIAAAFLRLVGSGVPRGRGHTGEQIGLLKRHGELPKANPLIFSPEISTLAFSPDSKLLVSGGADKTMHLWDVAERKEVRQFSGHRFAVNALVFSTDGKSLRRVNNSIPIARCSRVCR